MRKGLAAGGGAAVAQGDEAEWSPAQCHHLQSGDQRMRKGLPGTKLEPGWNQGLDATVDAWLA